MLKEVSFREKIGCCLPEDGILLAHSLTRQRVKNCLTQLTHLLLLLAAAGGVSRRLAVPAG